MKYIYDKDEELAKMHRGTNNLADHVTLNAHHSDDKSNGRRDNCTVPKDNESSRNGLTSAEEKEKLSGSSRRKDQERG